MNTIRMITVIICALIHFIAQPINAQVKSHSQDYLFCRLTTTEGLSNNNISSILKDEKGFLWIGTEYGLNQYDGHTFQKYFFTEEYTNNISSIQKDAYGNIWVLAGQYMIYDQKTKKFELAIDKIRQVGVDCKGIDKVYIDKQRDLWIIDGKNITHIGIDKRYKTYRLPLSESIISLIRLDGILYLSSAGKIYEYNLEKNTLRELEKVTSQISTNSKEIYLYGDEEKTLWCFSTESDFLLRKRHYSSDVEKVKLPLSDRKYVIRDVLDDDKGNIWVATDNSGVYILNKQSGSITNERSKVNDPSSMINDKVSSLYRDEEGTIWLAHYKGGVSYLLPYPKKIKGVNVDLNYSIASIYEDSEGYLYVGTDGDGLLKKPLGSDTFNKINIPARTIIDINQDSSGRLWIGTYTDGLYCINKNNISHYTTNNSGLINDNVWAIEEDGYHNIWYGTLQNGLGRFNPTSQSFTRHLKDRNVNCVLHLHYAGGDSLFVATNDGIGIVNTKTLQETIVKETKKGEKFRFNFVRVLYCDSRRWLWIGFVGGTAIWKLDSDEILYYNSENGLCNNLINDIIEDEDNNVWIATSNGLSHFIVNKNALTQSNPIKQIVNYGSFDGLTSVDLNKFARLTDGNIAVASEKGYNIILPLQNTLERNLTPKVTNILVDNNTLGNSQIQGNDSIINISLKSSLLPTDHYIRVYFSAFNYNSKRIQYAYQINDDEWQTISENYVILGPYSHGEYNLKIKACDENGILNDNYTEIKINIPSPFWMHPIAYTAYAILVGLIIVYIWYNNKRKTKAKIHKHQMEIEQQKRIELYDSKMDFLTNISHDIRTPLSLIITPLEKLVEDGKVKGSAAKQIKTVYKNAQYLLDLVNQLLDLRKIDVKADTVNLSTGNINSFINEICENFKYDAEKNHRVLYFHSTVGDLRILFDKEKINRIMYNLLSNALKFTSPGGHIFVELWNDDALLYFSVADDGIGISDENMNKIFTPFFQVKQNDVNYGAGIGLHIAKEYLSLCGGQIRVEHNTPTGCKFICNIPIIEQDFKEPDNIETDINTDINTNSSGKRPQLLLVEDNVEYREFLLNILSETYDVEAAQDGLQAIKILKKKDIDIIISDVMMPNIDGNKLCEIVKTTVEWSHIPVILLTARTADEHRMTGLKYGADDYLTKPVKLELLNLRIKKFLDWKEKCHNEFKTLNDIKTKDVTISSIDEQFVTAVHSIIDKNICDSTYSIDNFCSELNMSRTKLYRKFIAVTGMAPMEYMRVYRLKFARKKLEPGCSISEVAYNAGFTHPKYFTKYFKEQFGVTPSQYLKNIDNTTS